MLRRNASGSLTRDKAAISIILRHWPSASNFAARVRLKLFWFVRRLIMSVSVSCEAGEPLKDPSGGKSLI